MKSLPILRETKGHLTKHLYICPCLFALCVYNLVSTKFYREKSDKPGIVKIDSEATEWYLAAG